MQTFLPVPSFEESAKVLDMRRLGKQRVEAFQLINALITGPTCLYNLNTKKYNHSINKQITPGEYTIRKTPWYNHPACVMWRGFEASLCRYGKVMCTEWIKRGYKDSLLEKFNSLQSSYSNQNDPPWLGNLSFHSSHRSNLLRKNFVWYSVFGWTEKSDQPYVWPEAT